MKSKFARYGIPEEFTYDNGPQYAFEEFLSFAYELYVLQHLRHKLSRVAEHAVQTIKLLLKGRHALLHNLSSRASPCSTVGGGL